MGLVDGEAFFMGLATCFFAATATAVLCVLLCGPVALVGWASHAYLRRKRVAHWRRSRGYGEASLTSQHAALQGVVSTPATEASGRTEAERTSKPTVLHKNMGCGAASDAAHAVPDACGEDAAGRGATHAVVEPASTEILHPPSTDATRNEDHVGLLLDTQALLVVVALSTALLMWHMAVSLPFVVPRFVMLVRPTHRLQVCSAVVSPVWLDGGAAIDNCNSFLDLVPPS